MKLKARNFEVKQKNRGELLSSIPDTGDLKRVILYIEDDLANQELIRRVLRLRPNITLLCVPLAQPGIKLAHSHNPDLILSDINLPDSSGFEVLNHLKTSKDTRDIPVIAVSGNNTPDDIQRGINAGFDSYMTKPIDISKFLETIDSFLCISTHPIQQKLAPARL